MSRMLLIGGGDFFNRGIKQFDDFLIKKVNKENPIICYLPTASKDNESQINKFTSIYENEYNANVIVIKLTKESYSFDYLNDILLKSDIIYMGGGNTKLLLEKFYQNQIDKILINAIKKNIIIAGISAGAICLFKGAFSDYSSYQYKDTYYNYKMIEGFGFLNYNACPHYDMEGKEAFNEFGGIALENNSAIYIEDDYYESLTIKGSSVYYISKDKIIPLRKGRMSCLI